MKQVLIDLFKRFDKLLYNFSLGIVKGIVRNKNDTTI